MTHDALRWGVKKLVDRLREDELKPFFVGLFPKENAEFCSTELWKRQLWDDSILCQDHPKNVRFAINYFTAIGLGVLTEEKEQLRTWHHMASKHMMTRFKSSNYRIQVRIIILKVSLTASAVSWFWMWTTSWSCISNQFKSYQSYYWNNPWRWDAYRTSAPS